MVKIIKSKYQVDIPNKDVLSWLFDEPNHDVNAPLFVNYDNPSEIFTTAALISAVRKIGSGLRKVANVRKGDVVLLCAGNSIWYTPFLLGTLAAEGIFTGANPAYLQRELTHQISNSGATAIFASPAKIDLTLKCAAELGIPQSRVFLFDLIRSGTNPVQTLGDVLSVGEADWTRLTTRREMSETTAALSYSSGTSTGQPKACEITHLNMVACAASVIYHRARGDDARRARGIEVHPDVCAAFLPLFHIMGQNTFCIINVKMGRLTYIMATYSFPSLLEAIEKHRITFLLIAPPVAVQLATSPLTKTRDLSSVKNVYSGGAPLSKDVSLAVDRALGVEMTQAWGMSETAGTSALFGGEVCAPDRSAVGYLLANLELRIADDGELWLRGPGVFRTYWRDAVATGDAFVVDSEAGTAWFKTGDVGWVNEDGVLYLADRKKEMIKVKGFAVAPAELEEVLLQHPDVSDAAVIGITSAGIEQPRAYIVPSRTGVDPASVAAFLAARLAPYKHITGGVVFLEAIPKNPAGKILRRILRERAQREEGGRKAKL